MRTEIARLDLLLRRRSTIGYTIGMALYTFIVVVLYPQFRNATNLNELTKGHNAAAALFGVSGSLTSPSGWLNANIYANFLPLIVLLVSIGYGAAAIAGQNEDGVLGLFVVQPIRRTSFIWQKTFAMAVQVVVLNLGVALTALSGRWFDLSLGFGRLAGITITTILLSMDFGLFALFVGTASGRRGHAIGIASVVAAASFLISSMAPVISQVRTVRWTSVFYWSVGNNQIATGASLLDYVVLLGVGAVILGATLGSVRHLDVR